MGHRWDTGTSMPPQMPLQLLSLQVGGSSAETPEQSRTQNETCRIQWSSEHLGAAQNPGGFTRPCGHPKRERHSGAFQHW